MKVTSWGIKPGLTVLTGKPGQGKSRSLAWLAEEFVQERRKIGRPFNVVFHCPEGPGMFISEFVANTREAVLVDTLDKFKAAIGANTSPSRMAVDLHTGHYTYGHDWKHTDFQVEFCPYCGTKLPDIEPREDIPGPTHRPVADGDYCGTCGQRSRGCTCLNPSVAWQTVKP